MQVRIENPECPILNYFCNGTKSLEEISFRESCADRLLGFNHYLNAVEVARGQPALRILRLLQIRLRDLQIRLNQSDRGKMNLKARSQDEISELEKYLIEAKKKSKEARIRSVKRSEERSQLLHVV